MTRLTTTTGLAPSAEIPAYDRAALKPGILHLGPGAFFRAHFADYTDGALAASGGDWGIFVSSLRSLETVDDLNAQNGLYTLLTRDASGVQAKVVGSVLGGIGAAREPEPLRALLADPAVKIVSLTITEKAYGLDPRTGGLDLEHPAIKADLAAPEAPSGAVGWIVEGLALRRAAGLRPFTPLCCDNLPQNGKVLKRLVLEFAERRDPALRRWIEAEVPFPSTMVDRITPASTEATYADAERLTGREDRAAVEAEPFRQWAIEDDFVDGRPDWAAAGALMIRDVAPYEHMKLRMLNGAHSLLAYAGWLSGYAYIRDAMADPDLRRLAEAHMAAAASTLKPLEGVDFQSYARDLAARFANPAIAHQTWQIAMDGTQKLPQRLIEPAAEALEAAGAAPTYALAVAAWMRYAMGVAPDGTPHALRDPREAEIRALLEGVDRADGHAVAERLFRLPGLFPARLNPYQNWRGGVGAALDLALKEGPATLYRRPII